MSNLIIALVSSIRRRKKRVGAQGEDGGAGAEINNDAGAPPTGTVRDETLQYHRLCLVIGSTRTVHTVFDYLAYVGGRVVVSI